MARTKHETTGYSHQTNKNFVFKFFKNLNLLIAGIYKSESGQLQNSG